MFLTKLTNIVGSDYIVYDEHAKSSYEIDWRGNFSGKSLAVVKPQTVSQIQKIIRLCQEHNIAIVPQGGNTSLCGGSVPATICNKPQIILNSSLLNKILEIDTISNSITVEAGCTLANIIEVADINDRYFPLDIAAKDNCQIGGNIATNAGGIHVIKYGTMRDLVLGLEVILPNGEIINQLSKLRKNNTNFDLKQLFIGSEGTLGIITKAVLKLYSKPEQYITCLVGISNIEQAIIILRQLQCKFNICAFEIINDLTQEIYNTHFPNNQLPMSANWLILFELETIFEFDFETLANSLTILGINLDTTIIANTKAKRDNLWHIRENIPLAEKMHGLAIKHDIALPISNIGSFIEYNRKNILKHYPQAHIIIFGHLGDGNLHYNVQLDSKSNTKVNEIPINELVYNDVIKYCGSISAEHGIGQLKLDWYKNSSDRHGYLLAYQLKQHIDPQNIFNPGKLFSF